MIYFSLYTSTRIVLLSTKKLYTFSIPENIKPTCYTNLLLYIITYIFTCFFISFYRGGGAKAI